MSSLKDILSATGGLIGAGAIGGFAVHELSRRLALRSDKRGHLGRALAELLEVFFDLRVRELITSEISKKLRTNALQSAAIVDMILTQLGVAPNWAELHQHYEAALKEIAAYDPLLAFELRSKDAAQPILTKLVGLLAQDPAAQQLFPDLPTFLSKTVIDGLSDTLPRLAWKYGPLTWLRVRRHVRKNIAKSPKVEEYLKHLDALIPKDQGAQAAGA